jgi:hypothetical protein
MEVFDASDILDQKPPPEIEFQELLDTPGPKPQRPARKSKRTPSARAKKRKIEKSPKKSQEPTVECRLCLVQISASKKKSFTKLTKAVERKFNDVTQKTLRDSENLSKVICSQCELELKEAVEYREKLIKIQNQLESQLPVDKFFENVVVKCEVKDEAYGDPVGDDDDDFNLFDSTQILDQFDDDELMSPMPMKKPKQPRSQGPKEKKDPRVICPECGMMYANKPSLKKHIAK